LVRDAGRTLLAETPLADECGRVPGVLQDLGDRPVLRPEGYVPSLRPAAVPADPAVPGVQPGHEGAPRRGADRAAGVALGKADALARQPVDVWRLDLRLPVAAEVAVPEVVGQDEDDVRFVRGV